MRQRKGRREGSRGRILTCLVSCLERCQVRIWDTCTEILIRLWSSLDDLGWVMCTWLLHRQGEVTTCAFLNFLEDLGIDTEVKKCHLTSLNLCREISLVAVHNCRRSWVMTHRLESWLASFKFPRPIYGLESWLFQSEWHLYTWLTDTSFQLATSLDIIHPWRSLLWRIHSVILVVKIIKCLWKINFSSLFFCYFSAKLFLKMCRYDFYEIFKQTADLYVMGSQCRLCGQYIVCI